VTETGIAIVTRDYSLFESPVAVDYFTSSRGEKKPTAGRPATSSFRAEQALHLLKTWSSFVRLTSFSTRGLRLTISMSQALLCPAVQTEAALPVLCCQ